MSQTNPKITDFDYTPAIERRGPAPITHLPVNALSGDMDPTRDLRVLIEQLQASAREARSQVLQAETERDRLTAQLEQSRRQNEELRAHFVEITSIIRERDNALAEAERLGRVANEAQARLLTAQRELSDAQRQRDEVMRAKDDASRQREDTLRLKEDAQRQVEALNRSLSDTNRRLTEIQRQLTSVRQARDGAQAQNNELLQKLASSEDRISDLQDQLDTAEKTVAELRAEGADPAELAVAREERDAAQRQAEEAAAEIEQLRATITNLTEEKTAALEAGDAQVTALADAREQIEQLTRERDEARSESAAKDSLIEEIRGNPDEATAAELQTARQEIADLKAEREWVELRHRSTTQEITELQQQLHNRAEQIAVIQRALEDATMRTASVQAQLEQLKQEREMAMHGREEAMMSLSAAHKQIERIIRERDLIRQQSSESIMAMEAQIGALLAQLTAYEGGDPEAVTGTVEIQNLAARLMQSEEERRELAERLDKQREETIDLGAQLQAAQEQIRELSAHLAEARLQMLSGNRKLQRNTASVGDALHAQPPREVFDPGEQVMAIRQGFQAFLKNPSEIHLLTEIAGQAQAYAELARTCGLPATHQVGAAFASLTQDLFQYPEQITPALLRTLQQGVEFLTTLPKLPNLAQAKDPATAVVYTVDDDPDNCECIRLAMEASSIRTMCMHDPAQASIDLVETPCDLIFLDVSMPGMDGFELCTSIRGMALHLNTPVIFLTGLTTAENRVQSNMRGGNDFVGKPFLLGELTLKALMLMMKSQLHLA